MIEKKDGEQIFEYKFPGFIKEYNYLGNSPDDYEILQVLGGGSFSRVLKVKSKSNLEIYAMKKVDINYIIEDQDLDQKYYENEALILKKLNHSNVCKCYNIFRYNNFLYFIMEFMNNGDLNSFYAANISLNVQIPEDKVWDIFYKCLNGLDYIHRQGLIHRDIKLSNLFLDDDLNIKIGDFNISAVVDQNAAKKFNPQTQQELMNLLNGNTDLGTDGYKAPEIGNYHPYNQKVDVFAMGTSFFQLCYGCYPYRNKKNLEPEFFYQQNRYSKEVNYLIEKMIKKNENERITSGEAFAMAKKYFIKKFVKNSSVEAVMYCFFNYPNFTEYFSNNTIISFLTDFKREIGTSVFYTIQKFKNNNRDELDDALYELRKSLTKAGLDIKKENVEIDPGNLISFFIRKLNSELNEVIFKQLDDNDLRQYIILSSSFQFFPGQEENSFKEVINIYNKKLLSLMTRNFFNIMLTKKQCNNCGKIGLNFSMLHFVPINIDISYKKGINLNLRNAISFLCNDIITLNLDKKISCDYCKMNTIHKESKIFYHTAKNLIFVFDRGNNFNNNTFVDFSEQLVLNSSEVSRYKEVKYQLLGITSKIAKNDNQCEFISFISKGHNQWLSNRDNNIITFEEAKKRGTVISLFYYCYDNNMILQGENTANSFENIQNILLYQQFTEINRANSNKIIAHQLSGIDQNNNAMINSMPSQSFSGNNNMMLGNNNTMMMNSNNSNNNGIGINNINNNNINQGNGQFGFMVNSNGQIPMSMNNLMQNFNNLNIYY